MKKQEIFNIVTRILKIKFNSKIYNNFELEKAKKDLEIQINNLTNYVFENYLKTDYLSIDFIKWLHKEFYPKGTIIKTLRNGKLYHNPVWEYRLNENNHKEYNHLHSFQINIEADLLNYTNFYNSIKDKKRTDILRYYFDFLRVHPFADSNLTIISLICELEFFKYWFKSLDFLKTRFEDWKFNYFFLYEYENNKNKTWILEEIEKMIDDFHSWKLSQEIVEKKEKINLKTTQELFWWKIDNIDNPYFEEIDEYIKKLFLDIDINLWDYQVRKIIYNNTFHYLKNAIFRAPEKAHNTIISWYNSDMERIIEFCQKKIISNPFFKLNENIIKELHKNLYPNWFIQKNTDINGKEFIQMIPWEYRNINLEAKTAIDKNIYHKFQEIEKELKILIINFNNSKKQKDDILLFFVEFISIHPFWDGNWRTADILTDLLLIKNWFDPYYLWYLKQKDEIWFYEARNKSGKNKDLKYMYDFIDKHKKLD